MRTIATYRVEDTPLGTGGMGRVLLGTDIGGKHVAIKEILPQFAADEDIRARTENEVKMLRTLNNECIVKVFDQFPLDGNFYIVMELVDGLNLEQYIQQNGSIDTDKALALMVQILDTMQYVHEQAMVHRDMKPSNIMIRNNQRVCLLDFGIAKDMSNLAESRTVMGTVIGSDGYMSPEQASGFSIDHRADIYALGCVLHYMLTGHHAYATLANDYETRMNITQTPFPPLSKHSNKKFPERLQQIIFHATDRDMTKRYQTCREFATDLKALLPKPAKKPTGKIAVTVGREGCDVTVGDQLKKVSRSHLDISLAQEGGKRMLTITDHSSNGTLVNGRKMMKDKPQSFPLDSVAPLVYLACDTRYPLEWESVLQCLNQKLHDAQPDANDVRFASIPSREINLANLKSIPQKPTSLLGSVKNLFRK